LVSVDFFTVPTVKFRVLFVFLVLATDRRRVLHFNVTEHPSSEWTARQLIQALPWETPFRYLLRDRDIYRLLEDQYERLAQVHDKRFRRTHGRLHGGVAEVVERFLDCGLLEGGFVRVHCASCRAGFLVAFSCKCRYLCPSCHAKRLLVWSAWIEEEILDKVPHRQYVFTLPKRLRPYFLHDRRLLGLLSRVAYDTLREFISASLGERAAVPGVVASIQTFGTLLNWLSRPRRPHRDLPPRHPRRLRQGGPLHS
jgi:hypothetical protein